MPRLTRALGDVPLGAVWLDNGVLALVADLVASESFYFHAHRCLWDATAAIVTAGQPADAVTVMARLQAQGLAEAVGGMGYLVSVAGAAGGTRNVRRYAEIVAEKYAERALITACSDALAASWQTGGQLDDRIDRIAGLIARAEGLRKGVGRRLPMLRLDQLQAEAGRVRWAVKHVIPLASVGMLFGGSGTFKSFCFHA